MNFFKFRNFHLNSYLSNFASKKVIAMDLENKQLLILSSDQKKFLSQPICLAINTYYDQVIAIGEKADRLLNKTSDKTQIIYPMGSGRISSQDYLGKYLEQVVDKLNLFSFGNQLYLGKIGGMTPVHEQILSDIIKKKFGGKLELVDRCFAAYFYLAASKKVGADSIILLIDDSAMQVSVFSQGKQINQVQFGWGRELFISQLEQVIKEKYHLQISHQTAVATIGEVGYLNKKGEKSELKTTIRGKNVLTNLPDTVQISSADFEQEFDQIIYDLSQKLTDFFSNLDPDLLATVLDQGLVVISTGKLVANIDEKLAQYLNCRVMAPENQSDLVIKGLFLYGQENK